jgi:ribonuclease P protein component
MKTNNSFPKEERIVSQKLIDELFTSGQSHSLVAFPLRAVFFRDESRTTETNIRDESRTTETNIRDESRTTKTQVLMSVSKRRFKHAVDRNRVKRQLREAYRLNRHLLTDHLAGDEPLRIAFIWLSDQHLPTAEVKARMASLLKRMAKKLNS